MINKLWNTASDLAIELIKKDARYILKSDSNLNEFVMGMGCCFFTYKDKSKYDLSSYTDEQIDMMDNEGHDWYGAQDNILHKGFQPEFMEMVDELDKKFKVCGYPVRFTADSPEIYNW